MSTESWKSCAEAAKAWFGLSPFGACLFAHNQHLAYRSRVCPPRICHWQSRSQPPCSSQVIFQAKNHLKLSTSPFSLLPHFLWPCNARDGRFCCMTWAQNGMFTDALAREFGLRGLRMLTWGREERTDVWRCRYVRRMRRLNLTGKVTQQAVAAEFAGVGGMANNQLSSWVGNTFGQGVNALTRGRLLWCKTPSLLGSGSRPTMCLSTIWPHTNVQTEVLLGTVSQRIESHCTEEHWEYPTSYDAFCKDHRTQSLESTRDFGSLFKPISQLYTAWVKGDGGQGWRSCCRGSSRRLWRSPWRGWWMPKACLSLTPLHSLTQR